MQVAVVSRTGLNFLLRRGFPGKSLTLLGALSHRHQRLAMFFHDPNVHGAVTSCSDLHFFQTITPDHMRTGVQKRGGQKHWSDAKAARLANYRLAWSSNRS